MLEEVVKTEIQQAYSAWLGSRGFRGRRGQRQMIAEIARQIADPEGDERVCVIEAGTGIGKTVAYLMALIPLARRLRKRIVVATATVALQEQLVLRDLPDLAEHSPLRLTWSLAKGRRRYVCLAQLDARLRNPSQTRLDLGGTEDVEDSAPVYARLLDDFMAGRWDGDRDALADGISEPAWQRISTDARGCTARRCGFFAQCPYFVARQAHQDANVVVANHDLVLADLIGGGAVLPDPEDTVYVFDEAHHLPEKGQAHFQQSLRLGAFRDWLSSLDLAIGTISARFGTPGEFAGPARAVAALGEGIAQEIEALLAVTRALKFADDDAGELERFAGGVVPSDLAAAAEPLTRSLRSLCELLDTVAGRLQAVMDGELIVPNAGDADDFYALIGSLGGRADAAAALLLDYATADREGLGDAPPYARWARRVEDDVLIASGPIVAAEHLIEHVWSRAFGVVLTSATLRSLGRFEPYLASVGLPADTRCVALPSPFDYPRLGLLRVPAMRTDGGGRDAHTDEVAAILPELISEPIAHLVLFTSWRQMQAVFDALPGDLRGDVLMQGRHARQFILDSHRARIDDGARSIIFGLASFAEGIDLPGGYVAHVVIVKLPFAVPDDPMAQARAEWVEGRGGNAFMDVAVPEAALRLAQACGRLIRSERDRGVVTLLDRRIVERRYGRAILDALPPFAREFG